MKHRDGQKGTPDPVFAHVVPASDNDISELVLGNISGEPEQGVEMISRTVLDASNLTSKPWEEKRRKYTIPTPSKDELKAGIDLLVKSLQSVAGTTELMVGLYLGFSDGKFCSSTAYQRLNPGNHEDTIDAHFTEGKRLKEFEIDLRTPEMHYRLRAQKTWLTRRQLLYSGMIPLIALGIELTQDHVQRLIQIDPTLAYELIGISLGGGMLLAGLYMLTNPMRPILTARTTIAYTKPELEPWAEVASNIFSRKNDYETLQRMIRSQPT